VIRPSTDRCVSWLSEKPSAVLTRQLQRLLALADVECVAVMGDAHEGAVVPNGVVTATRSRWYPELVGADMGCGLTAVAFDGGWNVSVDRGRWLLDGLERLVPTLKHGELRRAPGLGDLRPQDLRHPRLAKLADREGRWELGTLGRGNHFLELAVDDSGRLWAVVHTGSRALGPALLAAYRNLDPPEPGGDWFHDARWLVRYASLNRWAILNRVADLVEAAGGPGLDEATVLDCPHNFPRIEGHRGRELLVHRKSANSAAAGEPGVIAGSMAEGSRIVRGLGNETALGSSSHGAGRVLGRKEAFRRLGAKDLAGRMGGVVYRQGLASRLLDEAPQAYRNLGVVMAGQVDLVKTVERLAPVLNDKRV
jgi:tRNA-splicing ligase RtcB